MIVLSCRVNDDFRFEFVQHRKNGVFKDKQESLVGCARGQGNVNGRAQCVRAAEIIDKTGSGIKRSTVLMHGDAQNIRIVPIDVLRSVAVMAVRVHDGDPPDAERMPDIFDHHGFNVDVAETPCAVGDQHGMMAWWPYQGKGVVNFAAQYFLRSGNCPAGGNEVGIRCQVLRIGNANMAAVDISVGGNARFVFHNIRKIQQAFFENLILCI
ncbi:MAG: hypothetical protein BWX99_02633 [Deltaproteobacteria bacterium ADurb.Bin151]|nr:MAG: hypothetical protein BWX99_02633 [Deltaproteobacteria bacterium ADurb.Bin151]